MASLLEALIFDRGHATTELPTGLEVVELNAGLTMLPLTSKQLTRLIGSNSDERIRSNWVLRTDVARLAAHMSAGRHVLYVFGESFGAGAQEAMGWFDREPIYGPVGTCDLEIDREPGYLVVPHADSAINAALRAIGIEADSGLDEYATVGLTRHRMLDDWLRPT